jgi:hypothetical protein
LTGARIGDDGDVEFRHSASHGAAVLQGKCSGAGPDGCVERTGMSLVGALPKTRLYSLLNWEALR